jgi:hypothetical protein
VTLMAVTGLAVLVTERLSARRESL